MKRAEQILTGSMAIAVLDTAYLSWRFVALQAGWVEPGTGLCSWTPGIDCDQVLRTPEARAFFVPNAILGWGFFSGCLIWWLVGRRLGERARWFVLGALGFWLGLATSFTFYFYYLLVQLDWLCPFCPWNHLWTWVAFGATVALWRETPSPPDRARGPGRDVVRLVIACVLYFFVCQAVWVLATYTFDWLPMAQMSPWGP